MTVIRNGPGSLPGATGSLGGATTAGLRRFAAPPRKPAPAGVSAAREAVSPAQAGAADRCELCGEQLAAGHAHLVDLQQRSIACACTACALLFTRPAGWSAPTGKPGWSAPTGKRSRYRTVPDRVRHDPRRPLTDAEWAELRVPVGIAFFFVNSSLGRVVAGYPSPAGVTECELDLAVWDRLAAGHPLLGALTPDVEAILVVRGQPPASEGGAETFLIPIDACYSLAGALRLNWHGFDGGAEVRRVLSDFLADLRQRAREV
jgi:hypothetical protein